MGYSVNALCVSSPEPSYRTLGVSGDAQGTPTPVGPRQLLWARSHRRGHLDWVSRAMQPEEPVRITSADVAEAPGRAGAADGKPTDDTGTIDAQRQNNNAQPTAQTGQVKGDAGHVADAPTSQVKDPETLEGAHEQAEEQPSPSPVLDSSTDGQAQTGTDPANAGNQSGGGSTDHSPAPAPLASPTSHALEPSSPSPRSTDERPQRPHDQSPVATPAPPEYTQRGTSTALARVIDGLSATQLFSGGTQRCEDVAEAVLKGVRLNPRYAWARPRRGRLMQEVRWCAACSVVVLGARLD
jgi:hypothetical protein